MLLQVVKLLWSSNGEKRKQFDSIQCQKWFELPQPSEWAYIVLYCTELASSLTCWTSWCRVGLKSSTVANISTHGCPTMPSRPNDYSKNSRDVRGERSLTLSSPSHGSLITNTDCKKELATRVWSGMSFANCFTAMNANGTALQRPVNCAVVSVCFCLTNVIPVLYSSSQLTLCLLL